MPKLPPRKAPVVFSLTAQLFLCYDDGAWPTTAQAAAFLAKELRKKGHGVAQFAMTPLNWSNSGLRIVRKPTKKNLKASR